MGVFLDEPFGRLDAVEVRHFDVQEVHIDCAFLGDLQVTFAINRFVDYRDIFPAFCDNRPEAGPDDRVIIRKDNSDAHGLLQANSPSRPPPIHNKNCAVHVT